MSLQGTHTHWGGLTIETVPGGIEVGQGEDRITAHGAHHSPLAAKPLDEDRWEEQRGHHHSTVDGAECHHPHSILTVEAALWKKDQPSEDRTV